MAAGEGRSEIIELLIRAGADTEAKNDVCLPKVPSSNQILNRCAILGHDAHPQTKCALTPMQPVQDGETPLDFAKDSSMEEEYHEAVSRAKIPQ